MKYKIKLSKSFKKSFKKLSLKDQMLFDTISKRMSEGEVLEPKYCDHPLKGRYMGFRECHLRPNLLLIYEKQDDKLILYCLDIGSHSELFRE